MGLSEDAIAVAAGKLAVIESADALQLAEARQRRPIPLAAYRDGDWCTVFFVIRQSDGWWRTELVAIHRGEVRGSGGGTGGILRRSDVRLGQPVSGGEFHCSTGIEDRSLVVIEGVSADDAVRMRHGGEVVAEAAVAAHGYFVLAAVVPWDADLKLEAA
jgi:hypothetical protein